MGNRHFANHGAFCKWRRETRSRVLVLAEKKRETGEPRLASDKGMFLLNTTAIDITCNLRVTACRGDSRLSAPSISLDIHAVDSRSMRRDGL